MPKFSIITPLHNKGDYVLQTIQSVLNQTLTDWEMIIVENGSTDNSVHVVSSYSDPRIQLVVSPKVGPGAARNYGLQLAKGEWILFLDADDLISPDFIEARLKYLIADEGVKSPDIIVGGWEEFSLAQTDCVQRRPGAETGGQKAIEESAIAAAPWALHAAIIRRSALGSNPWPEDIDGLPSEDTAFWFSLIRKKRVKILPGYGALYRITSQATRNRPENLSRWVEAIVSVVKMNTSFLQEQGEALTRSHIEYIMRGFESAYCQAIGASDQSAAILALKHAELWLSQCSWNPASIAIRKMLGIKIFCKIRSRVNLFRVLTYF